MKTDLLIVWLTLIAFVCGSVYAIIWQPPLPTDVAIFLDVLTVALAGTLVWAGKGEIALRRYEKFDWYKKMGLRETACLLERDVK
ncbi:hypothetical protein LCGC14_1082620 [marine sediment metagenome]|uniref:Uncharacterized protein n=1 Tax=marine sediment metagenome TaxID=412755 RepID=A0A0F9QKS3_9ZZZZ